MQAKLLKMTKTLFLRIFPVSIFTKYKNLFFLVRFLSDFHDSNVEMKKNILPTKVLEKNCKLFSQNVLFKIFDRNRKKKFK